MSRGFVKDGDQEEVPVVAPRAFIPEGMANYVTADGYEELLQEHTDLLNERDSVSGNENDARISRNYLNCRLSSLEKRIASAIVRDSDTDRDDTVSFGSYVKISIDGNIQRTVRITGADQADTSRGFISCFSPLATAIAGRRIGDNVPAEFPSGKKSIRILDVSFHSPDKPSCPSSALPASSTTASPVTSSSISALPTSSFPTASPVPPSSTPALPPSSLTAAPSSSAEIDPGTVLHADSGTVSESFQDQAAKSTSKPSPGCGPKIVPGTETHGSLRMPLPSPAKIGSTPCSSLKTNDLPQEDNNEILPLVNERGITIGRAPRWQCHDGSKLLHPVVHLHVFDSSGRLYLQKRPSWKKIQPDKWDTAVGGHVSFGEKIEQALLREAKEELRIDSFNPVFIKRYVFESNKEKELVHIYRCVYDGIILPSNEVSEGRFWTISEIEENMGRKVFTPNFESEYRKFLR